MKEIKDIVAAYEAVAQLNQQAVLATVVQVEGSSYRSPGARMLITEEGQLTGAISGGCLEGDALRKALLVIQQGRPMLATYDTSDEEDAVIGIGLGCNGIIQVLLEPLLSNDLNNPIHFFKELLQKREGAVLVTDFSLRDKRHPEQGTKLLVREDELQSLNGTPAFRNEINQVFVRRRSSFLGNSLATDGILSTFLEYVMPNIALVIGGAGNDIFPLVNFATVLGWEITLIDGRPAYANTARFASCQLIVADPEKGLEHVRIDDRTAFVLMSHNYQYDKAMLRHLIQKPVSYLGVLGPKKKSERLIRELKEEGEFIPETFFQNLFSPTGLDIGAETAEEIALSIIAEIKAVFANRQGKSLREMDGNIHAERRKWMEMDNA